MEKVMIGQKEYGITGIRPESEHILRIDFKDDIPNAGGDVKIFTAGNICCGFYQGYNTVYKARDQTVWLSDDESVYEEHQIEEG